MTRKLASIQRIISIDPIPDADKIEKATVQGWECVVAKSDGFQVGDLVIYIEIDSIVPPKPEFEFLKDRKYRVRTIRLKKQISQGLVLPLSYLPKKNWKEGDDVTDILGIKKYDPQYDLEQKQLQEQAQRTNSRIKKFFSQYPWYRKLFFKPKRGSWPKFIKKTDEERIQNMPWVCEREKDTLFSLTEKLDGQSVTYFLIKRAKFDFLGIKLGKSYEFGVCSRNLHLPKEDSSSYWTIARQYKIKEALMELIDDDDLVVLQGEIIGEGIQGNKYKIKGVDFYGFNLIFNGKSETSEDAKQIVHWHGIKWVPILEDDFVLKPTIPDNVDYAKGKSVIHKDVLREGLVCRNHSKNISFKIINPEFLLKNEE